MLEAATDAEIWWCPKNVVFSYSFCSCDGQVDLFRSMFRDSTIAESFVYRKTNVHISLIMALLHIFVRY